MIHHFSYIKSATDNPITDHWLKDGEYEIEMRGQKFKVNFHLRSPFDPKNSRVKGDYSGASTISPEDQLFLEEYRKAVRKGLPNKTFF